MDGTEGESGKEKEYCCGFGYMDQLDQLPPGKLDPVSRPRKKKSNKVLSPFYVTTGSSVVTTAGSGVTTSSSSVATGSSGVTTSSSGVATGGSGVATGSSDVTDEDLLKAIAIAQGIEFEPPHLKGPEVSDKITKYKADTQEEGFFDTSQIDNGEFSKEQINGFSNLKEKPSYEWGRDPENRNYSLELEELENVEIRHEIEIPESCQYNKTRQVVAESSPDWEEPQSEFVPCDREGAAPVITEPKPDDDNAHINKFENVMQDFEYTCERYYAKGTNMEGLRHAAEGKMDQAVKSWSKASAFGSDKAQYNLGLCYETGSGVVPNPYQAVKYYSAAEENNHPMATYNLAVLYLTGSHVEVDQDEKKALYLMEKAAKQGLVEAQAYLGMHYSGPGQCKDMEKAVHYFNAAANQNDAEALYYLGKCYENGLGGLPRDEKRAEELYTKCVVPGNQGNKP